MTNWKEQRKIISDLAKQADCAGDRAFWLDLLAYCRQRHNRLSALHIDCLIAVNRKGR